MVSRFEYRRIVQPAVVWMILQAAVISTAHADLIDTLCDAKTDPTTVIWALVEEAETTGMPLPTLNRLLAVGYRDANSIVDLRVLLCTIITLEERGLPPDPLFDQVEEGLGKRAPLTAIQTALLRQAEKLQYAQGLVAGGKEPVIDDINVQRVADLLDMGVPRDALDRLFGPAYQASTDMRVVAAEILGYGTVAGFPAPALDRITAAGLDNRSLTREWTYFIKVIKEARRKGIEDEQTADAAVAALSKQQSMNTLIRALGLESKRVYGGSSLN